MNEELQTQPQPSNAWRSPSIGAIASALSKAQGKMQNAAKDSVNPHFKSRYADLASVWSACRDALSQNEIAVVQLPGVDGNIVTVSTMLLHSSSEWLMSEISAAAANATPQAIGSALTYLRRYGLAAMVGVAPDDDDAESAQPQPHQAPRPQTQPPKKPAKQEELPPPVVARIQELVNETTFDLTGAFKKAGVQEIKHFSPDQAEKLIVFLEDELKKQQAEADAEE